MSNAIALQVEALHLWRGDHHLLRGVNLTVRPGQMLQVNGANGAGKTSLLRCIAGLQPIESGTICWQGQNIQDVRDTFAMATLYLGHHNALKLDLSAHENLAFSVGLTREVAGADIDAAFQRMSITQCADLPVRALSAGQKRRVALARLLLSRAPLWILDEPITNLDVRGIELVEQLLRAHLQQGGMVLVAAHQPLLANESFVGSVELSS